MHNELLGIGFALLNMIFVLIMYKFFEEQVSLFGLDFQRS